MTKLGRTRLGARFGVRFAWLRLAPRLLRPVVLLIFFPVLIASTQATAMGRFPGQKQPGRAQANRAQANPERANRGQARRSQQDSARGSKAPQGEAQAHAAAAAPQPSAPVAPNQRPNNAARPAGVGNGPRQEHLAEWLNRHQNLSPDEQEKALAAEPGFSQLPAQTQQRMQERLRQLNSMDPAQRQRVVSRVETMEKLTPRQRGEVTAATRQWGALPEDRRRMVGKAFRNLREMPAEQRMAILNSERFRSQFNDQERGVLHSLLTVEPYLPSPNADNGIQYGGK